MYCTYCGTAYAEGAAACPQCGRQIARFAAPPAIPNHLAGAVLTTLCCCMPFGIVSLVFAAQVNSKLAAGDLAGAQLASKNAKTWMIVAVVMGLLSGGAAALLTLMN